MGFIQQHSRFVVGTLALLRRLRDEFDVRVLIIYSQQATITFPLTVAARCLGIRVFQQYAEQQVPEDFRGGTRHFHYANQRSTFLLSPARTSGCVVISRALETLCQRRGASATLVVPALTSTEPLLMDPRPAPAVGSPCVLSYVGLGGRRDRLEQIVEIASAIRQKGLAVHLQMLGLTDAAQRDAHTWSVRAGLSEQTSIQGWLTREALEDAFRASDAFIFLREDDVSGQSAFPTRLPELMLTGRPVLCSRVGDIPLYLEDGRDLLFVEKNDVSEIATRFVALARTEGALEALGAAGARAAHREFDYRRWGLSLLTFLSNASG